MGRLERAVIMTVAELAARLILISPVETNRRAFHTAAKTLKHMLAEGSHDMRS